MGWGLVGSRLGCSAGIWSAFVHALLISIEKPATVAVVVRRKSWQAKPVATLQPEPEGRAGIKLVEGVGGGP